MEPAVGALQAGRQPGRQLRAGCCGVVPAWLQCLACRGAGRLRPARRRGRGRLWEPAHRVLALLHGLGLRFWPRHKVEGRPSALESQHGPEERRPRGLWRTLRSRIARCGPGVSWLWISCGWALSCLCATRAGAIGRAASSWRGCVLNCSAASSWSRPSSQGRQRALASLRPIMSGPRCRAPAAGPPQRRRPGLAASQTASRPCPPPAPSTPGGRSGCSRPPLPLPLLPAPAPAALLCWALRTRLHQRTGHQGRHMGVHRAQGSARTRTGSALLDLGLQASISSLQQVVGVAQALHFGLVLGHSRACVCSLLLRRRARLVGLRQLACAAPGGSDACAWPVWHLCNGRGATARADCLAGWHECCAAL